MIRVAVLDDYIVGIAEEFGDLGLPLRRAEQSTPSTARRSPP